MFVIAIDGELLLVQDIESDLESEGPPDWIFSVLRAQNGTQASGHLKGSFVGLLANRHLPLIDDLTDDSGNEFAGRVEAFGRAVVQPDPSTAAATAQLGPTAGMPAPMVVAVVPASITPAATSSESTPPFLGAVATNANSAFVKPFAPDLEDQDLQLELWNALMTNLGSSEIDRPLTNVLSIPTLMSTVVPPQQ